MTDKSKQNLRYQKADTTWRKTSYRGLTSDQKKMVKLVEKHRLLEKDLNYFWANAPRQENDAVNWDAMSSTQLDYFDFLNKESEKVSSSIDRLEDKGIDQDATMEYFMQLNIKSVCF